LGDAGLGWAVHFQPELETQSVDEREALQRGRLRALLPRFGVDPDAPLTEAPFTLKSQLRDAYPFGLLQVPLE
jgi:phenylacetate-coenzyme A ligase PaaK-like adenylate-forming protein